jgi:hypothetical protein
MINNTSSNKAH